MNASVKTALAAEKDGEALEWTNEKGDASGTVTPLDRHQFQSLSCRRVRIVNNLGRRTQQGVYRFCEKPAGSWKLAGPA
jgi:surface antigen